MAYLFAYGTLQSKPVQIANFGRPLNGQADTLLGYSLECVEITDPQVLKTSGQHYHPIVQYTGEDADEVPGTLFEVSEEDLLKADAYEVSDYQRVRARVKSGIECWVYVSADQ